MKDLFETPELIPPNVKVLLDEYENSMQNEDFEAYESLKELQGKLNKLGFTFDYYLDAVPYDLRKTKADKSNYITLWFNNEPFLTMLEKYKSFKEAVNQAREICEKSQFSFTINTPLTRSLR